MELKANYTIERKNYGNGHGYKYDGKKLPGVTTITGVIDKHGLDRWRVAHAAEFIKESGERAKTIGDLLHKAAEYHTQGKQIELEVPQDYAEQFMNSYNSFCLWWQEQKIKVVACELPVGSLTFGYAGTVDFIGERDGKIILLDYKTIKTVDDKGDEKKDIVLYDENILQVDAYKVAFEEMFSLKISEIEVVKFGKENGKLYLFPIEYTSEDFQVFLAAKQIYDWQELLKKKQNQTRRSPAVPPGTF